MKLIFLTKKKKRKKEKKAKIKETASQNNDEQEIGSWRGQPNAGGLFMGKIKLWEMKHFDLILEVSNLITYESCDKRGPPPLRREGHRSHDDWRVGGSNPIVAVVVEVVSRQKTSLSGGRHRDSLLRAENNSEWN